MTLKSFLYAGFFSCIFLTATPVVPEGLAGSYLAGNFARIENDYEASASFFSKALEHDIDNIYLLENMLFALVAKGDVEGSVDIAEHLLKLGAETHLAELITLAHDIKVKNFSAAEATILKQDEKFTPLFSRLMIGWIRFGQGKMSRMLTVFDTIDSKDILQVFAQYHKALGLAAVGDFEAAAKIMDGNGEEPLHLNRGSIIAHIQILMQLDRREDALKILNNSFIDTDDLQFKRLHKKILTGEEVFYDFVVNEEEGVAEVFFTLANTLNNENSKHSSLLYARIAEYLRPDHMSAVLLAAEILQEQEQFDLASETYAKVPKKHYLFLNTEIGRSETLLAAQKTPEAIEALKGLTKIYPNTAYVFMALGDIYRGDENFEEARVWYEKTVDLVDGKEKLYWFLFYSLGITNERLGDWDFAEKNLRKALAFSPNEPLVLNYLGYSLVENNIKLDEAQRMIEDAVKGDPNNGYITDSLGWVLYRLGKFEEAVIPMERAVELISNDPIINDHLGDVYWKVGRKREAKFQWKRALSFDPVEKEAENIRRKLDMGLDLALNFIANDNLLEEKKNGNAN